MTPYPGLDRPTATRHGDRRIARYGASVALVLVARLAVAQSPLPPLDLQAAVQHAVQRATSLQALQATVRGLREAAVAASQRADPVLRLSLDNVPVDGADRFSIARDFMTMRSIGLMQTFTRDEKLHARAARVEREADAALAERAARASRVQRDAALAWFERRAREQRVGLLRGHLEIAQQQIDAADSAARGGRSVLAPSITARDEKARVHQALLGAEADANSARRDLARWTGTPPDQPLASAPSIARTSLTEVAVPDTIARHPDLVQMRAREAVADAAVELARQERTPDWSAEVMFSQRGSRYANMATVAISLPLPLDRPQRQDRALAARLAQREALRAEREERERDLRAEVARWKDGWHAGLARLVLIDAQREPLARQRAEAALAAYGGGAGSLARVLAARRMVLALQLERIEIELETARLWARLEYLIPDTAALAVKE